MAIYRNVSMSFWTDSKVADDFTAEDRYFYLYLFTNPHTNLCGCYEIHTPIHLLFLLFTIILTNDFRTKILDINLGLVA